MAWLFTGLTQGLGLGLAAVAIVGAGIAAPVSLVGIYLGRCSELDETDIVWLRECAPKVTGGIPLSLTYN